MSFTNRSIYDKAMKKGLLNLLYNLLTLRPCFGCFNPELVETVAKGGDGQRVFVDRDFIGSSQGRLYSRKLSTKSGRVKRLNLVSSLASMFCNYTIFFTQFGFI